MRFTHQPPLSRLAPELAEWFASPLGQDLLSVEQEMLDQFLPQLHGHHLLQVGVDRHLSLYESSPITHKFSCVPDFGLGMQTTQFVAANDELPIESGTMDVVLLHHALDFARRPHQVLREAERVLRPGGHLLIVGFNPLSLWGLYRKLHWRARKQAPWLGHFISYWRLCDWLSLLELTRLRHVSDFYLPPFKNARWRRWFGFLHNDYVSRRSPGGAVMLVVARKDVFGMTPLKPAWRASQLLNLPVGKPATRGHARESR